MKPDDSNAATQEAIEAWAAEEKCPVLGVHAISLAQPHIIMYRFQNLANKYCHLVLKLGVATKQVHNVSWGQSATQQVIDQNSGS